MKRAVIMMLALALSSAAWSHAADKPKFKEIEIDRQFKPYLLGNPLLMQVAGAKVIREKGGRTVLLSVASTVLKDDSPKERIRVEKVCRIKALAGIVAEQNGVQVCHTENLNESTVVVIDDKGESGSSVSDLLQFTRTKVEGITRDMPVVGRWLSKDGEVTYLAIGVILDKNGEVVENDEGD